MVRNPTATTTTLMTYPDSDGFIRSDYRRADLPRGAAAGYAEPFDIKKIVDNVATIRYLDFAVGENVYISTTEEMTVTLTDGIVYAKIDTTDWTVDSLGVDAVNLYPPDSEDGQYTFKPLYLVETINLKPRIVRDLRNCALPRWA